MAYTTTLPVKSIPKAMKAPKWNTTAAAQNILVQRGDADRESESGLEEDGEIVERLPDELARGFERHRAEQSVVRRHEVVMHDMSSYREGGRVQPSRCDLRESGSQHQKAEEQRCERDRPGVGSRLGALPATQCVDGEGATPVGCGHDDDHRREIRAGVVDVAEGVGESIDREEQQTRDARREPGVIPDEERNRRDGQGDRNGRDDP